MVAGDLVNTASRLQSVARAGHGPRRRGDPARAPRARSPSRTPASRPLKGKAAPVAGVAGAARRRRARRPRSVGPRSRRRSSAATTELRLLKDLFHATAREQPRAARVDHRPGRHRQEPARVGVPEVPRRPRRDASGGTTGRSPAVRRGDHVLGARRDGPLPRCGLLETRRPGHDARRRSPRCSRARARRGRAALDRAGRCSPCSGRRGAGRRPRRAVPRLADVLRAARRDRHRRAAVRGPPLGRRRRCSTSSTTCSSGAAASRS